MALPTITSFTANTTISSSEMNTNLSNLKERSDIAPTETDHITLTPGTSKLVRGAVLRQDNTTDTYSNSQVILTGWRHIQHNGASNATASVTFGVTFATTPIVVVSFAGYKATTGAGSTLNDYVYDNAGNAKVGAISTTGMTVGFFHEDGTSGLGGGTSGLAISWIAIGTLS